MVRRKKGHRLISVILTLCILVSYSPQNIVYAGTEPTATVVREGVLDLTLNTETLAYISVSGEVKSVNPTTTPISDTMEGWSWIPSSRTLTLSGADIKGTFESSTTYGIKLPASAKIVLEDGTVNNVVAGKSNVDSYGIYSSGNFTIEGSGELNVISGMASNNSWGLASDSWISIYSKVNVYAQEAMRSYGGYFFNGADVTAVAGVGSNISVGVYVPSDTLYLDSGAKLSANSDFAPSTFGAVAYKFTAKNNSRFMAVGGKAYKISSSDTSYGLQVTMPGSVTIEPNALIILKSNFEATYRGAFKYTYAHLFTSIAGSWNSNFVVYGPDTFNVLKPTTDSYGYLFNYSTENMAEAGMVYDKATHTLTLTNCICDER